jgi:hypothetical protein
MVGLNRPWTFCFRDPSRHGEDGRSSPLIVLPVPSRCGLPHSTIIDGKYFASESADSGLQLVPFWESVESRATDLFGRPAIAGKDYALTELVRCKSRHEAGVPEALETCIDRYLVPTLEASGARVIVVYGRHARKAFCEVFQLDRQTMVQGPVTIAGRARMVVILKHPAHYLRMNLPAEQLEPDDLNALRSWLHYV